MKRRRTFSVATTRSPTSSSASAAANKKNKKNSESRYRVFLQCPRCEKKIETETSAIALVHGHGIGMSCGDCLMTDVQIVPLRLTGWELLEEKKPPQPEGQ